MTDNAPSEAVYKLLLRLRGEEYANLYLVAEHERLAYIHWWQEHYDTENDQIKNLGLEPEYFPNLRAAKKFLEEMEAYDRKRGKKPNKAKTVSGPP